MGGGWAVDGGNKNCFKCMIQSMGECMKVL